MTRTNKITTHSAEYSVVVKTSSERIARLEATDDQFSRKIQEIRDNFNSRIEKLQQLINDNDTKSFITATKIIKDVEHMNEKIRN